MKLINFKVSIQTNHSKKIHKAHSLVPLNKHMSITLKISQLKTVFSTIEKKLILKRKNI